MDAFRQGTAVTEEVFHEAVECPLWHSFELQAVRKRRFITGCASVELVRLSKRQLANR